jgi:hypothetical protein
MLWFGRVRRWRGASPMPFLQVQWEPTRARTSDAEKAHNAKYALDSFALLNSGRLVDQMLDSIQREVLIPNGHWTPFRNEIFKNVLKGLKEPSAAALFAVLYDKAYHHSFPTVKGNVKTFSQWSGIDKADLKLSLKELRKKGLVGLEEASNSDRGSQAQRWEIPLAAHFDLDGGNWTPVPRFLVKEYIPAYPDSVLLLMVLHHQNLGWQGVCYAKAKTLAEKIGWSSSRRVAKALDLMSDSNLWKVLETELPRPLTSDSRSFKNGTVTHYRLRAVRYEEIKKGIQTMRLRKFALERFGVPPVLIESSRTTRENHRSTSWRKLEGMAALLKNKN